MGKAPEGGTTTAPGSQADRADHLGGDLLAQDALGLVRFEIGPPPDRMGRADFVLRDFSAEQRRELDLLADRCADAVEQLLAQGLATTRNQLH